MPLEEYDQVIEPSAGNGAFSRQIDNVIAFDLEPEHPSIQKQDWFEYSQPRDSSRKVLVVGNPPFGQQNNLAVKFINHAATFADTIAFILPKSFMKDSIQARLHKNLHLTSWVSLPSNSFVLEGTSIDVPCIFQVWDYDGTKQRTLVKTPTPLGFQFVKKANNPDLAVQRVGGRAGTVSLDWVSKNEQSHYFIKLTSSTLTLEALVEQLSSLTYPGRNYGVGPKTISKRELLLELQKIGSSFITKN